MHQRSPENQPTTDLLKDWETLSQGNPSFRENARLIVSLFEKGLDNKADIGGWHGTSLEAIQFTLRMGSIPPSVVSNALYEPGHLFYYPPEAGDFGTTEDAKSQRLGKGGAMGYAGLNATMGYCMQKFGLDFTNSDPQTAFRSVIEHMQTYDQHSDQGYQFLETLGITRTMAEEAATTSLERKGILIALSAKGLEQMNSSDGDHPGEDRKIFVPSGLPLRMVVGIEPLGIQELEYFEKLQTWVDSKI